MRMHDQMGANRWLDWGLRWVAAGVFSLWLGAAAIAQESAPPVTQQPPTDQQPSTTTVLTSGPCPAPGDSPEANDQKTQHITPDEAKQLFSAVDVLLKFSSDESGLPIKSEVKRQMTSRDIVESYLKQKFDEDEGAKRLQRAEIVLNKFGLLDRDFALKPFLLALLKEQIEAYYDAKTKTVYMLDWVEPDEQKPVLAHELTHALQDQRTDLEKWSDQTPDDVSTNFDEDKDHLARDEMDTAREAVTEGQATAVMMDCILKPLGKSLIKDPELIDVVKDQMSGSENSPVLARAPLLLSKSLLFPYREGLSFEQDVWMDKGKEAAFAGTLDHPPTSSWEIMNPREYEARHLPAVPLMPDIHPLVDKLYKPYDIGQVGQLDLQIMAEIYSGDQAARDLTPAWDGGLYWAGQRLSAKTPAEQASTKSISLLYLSAWKNAASAQAFAALYAHELDKKYTDVKADAAAQRTAPASETSDAQEQVFTTEEGPVVITTRGTLVFVTESFDLDLARKLATLMLNAQGTGPLKMARELEPPPPGFVAAREPLTGPFVEFFANAGVMKAAVDAAEKAGRPVLDHRIRASSSVGSSPTSR
jgi:hypothetical protein